MEDVPDTTTEDFKGFEEEFEAGELSPYTEAIARFDVAQNELVGVLENLTPEDDVQTQAEATVLHGNKVFNEFLVCAKLTDSEYGDNEARITVIANLMLGEEEKRLVALENIPMFSDITFAHQTREYLEPVIREIYEESDSDEVKLQLLLATFSTCLNGDLQMAFNQLVKLKQIIDKDREAATEQLENKKAVARKIGGGILNVVTTALGVAGGIMLSRYLGKK